MRGLGLASQLTSVQASPHTLLVTAGAWAGPGRKAPAPRLAAYRVGRDTLVVRLEEGRADDQPAPKQAPSSPDLRAVVAQRSRRLSAVNTLPPLALGAAAGSPPPREAPLRGLQRLGQIVSESFLVFRLAVQLFGYVGLGWRWICSFLQLLLYAALLLPGFLQMVAWYYFSSRIIRSIRYGKESRQVLDLYVPRGHWANRSEGLRPVVIYVTGGAWTIGYKAWGALLSRRLSKAGVLVCCLDYRNFPQATALEMVQDINCGVSWVLSNILHYGGDPGQVFLAGQSCGGHLASLAVLTQAEQQGLGQHVPGGSPAWDVTRIRAFVGISGVYNVHDLVDHFDRRGLYKSLFLRIMSIHGEPQLKLLSPAYVAAHVLVPAEQQVQQAQRQSEEGEGEGEGAGGGVEGSSSALGSEGEGESGSVASDSAALEEVAGAGSCTESSTSSGEVEEEQPLLAPAPSWALALAEGGALQAGKAAPRQLPGLPHSGPFHGSSASSLIGAAWPGLDLGGGGDGRSVAAKVAAAAAGAAREAKVPPAASAAAAAAAAAAVEQEEEAVLLPGLGGGRTPSELMPPMLLLHGTADRCAPVEGAEQFEQALRDAGVDVQLKFYPGGTHTSPLLEDPMRGGEDALTNDILSLIHGRPASHRYRTLCPQFLIDLAAKVCPF